MLDSCVVYTYLLVTLCVGFFYARKIRTFRDFALSHRKYSTPTIIATLLATIIGGGSTFGISSKTFQYGVIYLFSFYGFVVNRFLVARFFVPRFASFLGKVSVGDIMERYYGTHGKVITGVFTILVSLGSVGTQCRAVGYVLQFFTGLKIEYGILLASGVFVFYAALGGMRSVVGTDVVQCCILLVVLPLVFFVALGSLGGIGEFLARIPQDKLSVQSTSILFSVSNFFFILIFGSFDPSFMQRILMSRDINQAQNSVHVVGYVSFFLLTIMGLVGMCSHILFPEIEGKWCLLFAIDKTLPVFLRGLAIAGLLSALMSTADSDLNCVGIAAVNDVIEPFLRREIAEKAKILLARGMTFLFGVFSVCTALYFEDILSIMKIAFSFWGPTVLIPLAFGLYGRFIAKVPYLLFSLLSILLVFFWNIYFAERIQIDGFLIGSFLAFLLFFFFVRRGHAQS